MVGYFTPFSYIKGTTRRTTTKKFIFISNNNNNNFFFSLDRAIEEGHWDDADTNWLLSTIGITNTIGRVLAGLVSSFPGMDATFMNNIALIIAGVATGVSGLVLTVPYQYAYCAIFGFSTGYFPLSLCLSLYPFFFDNNNNIKNSFQQLLHHFVQSWSSIF